MNREQLVDKASQAIRIADGSHTMGAGRLAEVVLDAILPQVSTVAELEALPDGVRLLGADGVTWQRNYVGSWLSDQHLTRRAETLLTLKKANPLTVIWQPEVTA